MCKHFHCLPYAGGIMEQPGYVVVRMEKVIDAYDDWQEFESNRETPSN